MGDMVNHPPHYQSDKGIEVIDVIEAFAADDYFLGNVIKYALRANKKHESPLEDLKKARWYLTRKIENIEKDLRLKCS